MASNDLGIKEEVYERLKAHKRGDESFSETLDRILRTLDADWRTNAGFLSEEEAAGFATEVRRTEAKACRPSRPGREPRSAPPTPSRRRPPLAPPGRGSSPRGP
jgi:predicted CopG family antitoxin